MSDYLDKYENLKVAHDISLSDPSDTYMRTAKPKDLVLTIELTNQCIKDLVAIKKQYPTFSYCDIINANIEICHIESQRLEERFYTIVRHFNTEWKKCQRKGITSRTLYLSTIRKIHIKKAEATHVNGISEKLNELSEKYTELLFHLQSCSCHGKYSNSGAKYDLVGDKQQLRKRQELRQHVSTALWFAESYGIKVTCLTCESEEGKEFKLKLETSGRRYAHLADKEKQNIRDLIYILDRFGISDKTYHELHKLNDDMPSISVIKECRQSLSSNTQFHRTPNGVRVSVTEEIISMIRDAKGWEANGTKPFEIKFGGDGTKVSRISNFVSFTLTNLCSQEGKSSSLDQRVIAITKLHESYDAIKADMHELFEELNSIIENPVVTVDGQSVNLAFFMTCDMKMVNLLLGLKAASASQGCPWCTEHSSKYHILPNNYDEHNKSPMARDILQMKNCAVFKDGMKNQPLVLFPVHRIVPDLLHLLLRIVDILERNLLDEAYELDHEASVKKQAQTNVTKVTSAIKACGLPFEIWKSTDNRQSRDFQWTALTGDQKLKLLSQLPLKLRGLLHQETEETIVQIWTDFYDLFLKLNSDKSLDPDDVFIQAKSWIEVFKSVGDKRKGYAHKNVTPYMHCLMAHIPHFLKTCGSIKRYSGQSLEKTMDDIKQVFRKKTAKFDVVKESLVVRKRIEMLHSGKKSEKRPMKRKYDKHDDDFWAHGKSEMCARKKQRMEEEVSALQSTEDIENMSDQDIRNKLRALGVRTRIRNRQKLVKMLRDACR